MHRPRGETQGRQSRGSNDRRKGGNRGGATVSARFATRDLQSGGSQPSGGRKLSSPSAVFSDAEGCSEGQAGSMLDITTLECRNRRPRSQMLSHIFTLAEGGCGSFSEADHPRRTSEDRWESRGDRLMVPGAGCPRESSWEAIWHCFPGVPHISHGWLDPRSGAA